MLTAIVLIKNNKETIHRCLLSIKDKCSQIIVGNNKSTDGTLEICKLEKCEIIDVDNDDHDVLIKSSKNENIIIIHPWEFIVAGSENLKGQIGHSAFVQVLNGKTITKEVRIIKKDQSFNRKIDDYSKSTFLDLILFSDQPRFTTVSNNKYLQVYEFLTSKKYDEFISHADRYLFEYQKGISSTMLTYHTALVKVHHQHKSKEAIQRAISCIAVNPLMAEFWCVLGDAFYLIKEYKKSIDFYENAIILGSQRLKSDKWPVEIEKYKEYPNKMIESCNSIITTSKLYIPIS